MPVQGIEFAVDVSQLRDAMGRFSRYSKELEDTRLQPIAVNLAQYMLWAAETHIPSKRVSESFITDIQVSPQGTRVDLHLPEDWNRLAVWLLEGVAPHPIFPVRRKALWWDAGEKGGRTKGAPNRAPKIIMQPDRPVKYVMHFGFLGYDYLSRIEETVMEDGIIDPGGIATRFGREAELKLTPGPAALARGAERRVAGIRKLQRLFPHRFGGKR